MQSAMSGMHRPQQRGTPPIQSSMQSQEAVQGQTSAPVTGSSSNTNSVDMDKIYQWIVELANVSTRENSLLELRYVQSGAAANSYLMMAKGLVTQVALYLATSESYHLLTNVFFHNL